MSTPTLGFLYQTRTILRLSSCAPSRFWQREFSNSSSCALRKRPGRHTLTREEQADISPGFDTSSTLTPGENLKFRAIFEAAAKGLPPPSLQTRAEEQALYKQQQYTPGVGLDKIFDEVAKARDSDGSSAPSAYSASTTENAATNKGSANVVLKEMPAHFPAFLQGVWRDVRRAMVIDPLHFPNESNAEKEVFQPHILHSADATVREQRKADIAEIRSRLNEAQSDFAVWHVLEQSVFPRIRTLVKQVRARLEGAMNKKGSHSVGKKTARRVNEVQQNERLSPTNKGQEAVGAIIQSTYSVHLLNALRVLRTRFPQSPYALALIPAVKKLDPVSQVLGLSTELYNELLYILWRQHADIFECARIVEDMSSQGLVGDVYTTAVYLDAQRDNKASKVHSELTTPLRAAWWHLPIVQEALTRWSEAIDLLEARAAEEKRYREKWHAEHSTLEVYNDNYKPKRKTPHTYSTREPIAQAVNAP